MRPHRKPTRKTFGAILTHVSPFFQMSTLNVIVQLVIGEKSFATSVARETFLPCMLFFNVHFVRVNFLKGSTATVAFEAFLGVSVVHVAS